MRYEGEEEEEEEEVVAHLLHCTMAMLPSARVTLKNPLPAREG